MTAGIAPCDAAGLPGAMARGWIDGATDTRNALSAWMGANQPHHYGRTALTPGLR